MNLEQMALDPTLTQLLQEIVRAHGKIQQLQARIVELEKQPHNGTWAPEVQTSHAELKQP